MKVKEILQTKTKDILTTTRTESVVTAMEQLLSNKISCLPVVDGKRLIGIISDKDIFRAVYENRKTFEEFKVEDLMTTDLIVGVEDDDIEYISNLITNNKIRHIPIVENDSLIGLISIGDVVKAKEKHIKTENRFLKQYIDGSYPW